MPTFAPVIAHEALASSLMHSDFMHKIKVNRLRRHELTVYALVWLAIFAAPLVSQLLETTGSGTVFSWRLPLTAWRDFLPFFCLFWLHDLFVAPLLTRPGRHKIYAPAALALVVVFMLVTCVRMPGASGEGSMPPPMAPHAPGAGEIPPPPRPLNAPGGEGPMMGTVGEDHPGSLIGLIYLAMAVTMCGLNVAVKLYFKSQRDARQREALRRESLKHELEALKFQINPHFFMNTLNNIHALVDIEPERAKEAIIELSVLMRYVLYDGSQGMVPLSSELSFIEHYVALMRLRFTDKVQVETHFPERVPDVTLPPLIYATFAENAFKHGISYRRESFVKMSVAVSEEGVLFECHNSIPPESVRPARPDLTRGVPPRATGLRHHGIGLENVRKRLDLIYGEDGYRLSITHNDATYDVSLLLPGKGHSGS